MPTKIEWADETWNPISGCTPVGAGCDNCYAARMAKRLRGRCGYPAVAPFAPGVLHGDKLDHLDRWRKPRAVFVCSMGDLFHRSVPREVLTQTLVQAAIAEHHTYLFLSKRPKRMRDTLCRWLDQMSDDNRLPANWWCGVSAWDQASVDEFVPPLREVPAQNRFLCLEPLLGPVNLSRVATAHLPRGGRLGIDAVIVGGEMGPGARPLHPSWVRAVRDQCAAGGVPFHFKSWGDWLPLSRKQIGDDRPSTTRIHFWPDHHISFRVGRKMAGRSLDGVVHDAMPWRRESATLT